MLESTEKGEVRKTVGNYRLILMNDPNLQGAFRLNMFTDKIDITRDLGWYRESDSLTDVDLKFLVVYLEKHYGLSNEKRIEDVIKVVANENRYHPVLDRINSITWDGRERIRYALHHFLGAEVSEYTYEVMKLFMIGTIARISCPGIKFEVMLCLVGGQGAGKSTFLRLAAGILKADGGHVTIDGEKVFENIKAKKKFFYIPDDAHFFSNASPLDMMEYYSVVYEHFDKDRFHKLMGNFGLDEKRKLHTFSKGMKKQVSVILGICSNTDYLFCDETFDGLDPVMRQAVKSLFASEIMNREFTPVIASHNLRELEDICDHVGLLHKGGILLSKDLEDMKLNIHKIQCVLKEGMTADDLKGLQILSQEGRGRLLTLTVRGTKQEAEDIMNRYEPVFFECIPLSLEEIFISETEVAGYDIRKLIF